MTGNLAEEAFTSVIVAARAGAPWACRELWQQHAPAVSAFLTARGSREPDDLTSEVFLTVFDRLESFEGDAAAFRSFVFSVAYRRLVDEWRMRSRRGETVELIAEQDPRRASSAEEEATRRLGDDAALRLLDALPDDQRDVMVLRIVADLTVEQVAQILSKTPGAVKALQRRALARLSKDIEKKTDAPRTPRGPSNDSE